MRHVVKYLLVLAVLMSGFYMARMFRVPQPADVGVETPAENKTTDLPMLGEDVGPAQTVPDRLPVAAPADVDKTSAAVVNELAKFDHRESVHRIEAETQQRTLGGQPTVRRPAGPRRQRSQPDEDWQRGTRYDGDQQRGGDVDTWYPSSSEEDSTDERPGDSRGWMDSETESSSDDRRTESVEPYDSSRATRRGAAYDNAVPDFAADYEPWLEPLEESARPDPNRVESYEPSDPWGEVLPGDEQKEHRPVRRHRIVEGDTLQHLAERYLGGRDRYLDLYEANRDVLFHPRLLPIGIEIVVPGRPNAHLADEDEYSDDLTAEADASGDVDHTRSEADSAYSPWGEY